MGDKSLGERVLELEQRVDEHTLAILALRDAISKLEGVVPGLVESSHKHPGRKAGYKRKNG